MKIRLLAMSAALSVSAVATSAFAEDGFYAGGSLGMSATGFNVQAEGYREILTEPFRGWRQDGAIDTDATTRHQDFSGFVGYRRDLKTLENGSVLFGRVEGGFSMGSSSVFQEENIGFTNMEITSTRGKSGYGALHVGLEKNGWRGYAVGGMTIAQQSVDVTPYQYSLNKESNMRLKKKGNVPLLDLGFGVERDVSEKMAVRVEFKHSIDPNGVSGSFVDDNISGARIAYDAKGAFSNSRVGLGVVFKF